MPIRGSDHWIKSYAQMVLSVLLENSQNSMTCDWNINKFQLRQRSMVQCLLASWKWTLNSETSIEHAESKLFFTKHLMFAAFCLSHTHVKPNQALFMFSCLLLLLILFRNSGHYMLDHYLRFQYLRYSFHILQVFLCFNDFKVYVLFFCRSRLISG